MNAETEAKIAGRRPRENDSRFEMRISARKYLALSALAQEQGTSTAAVVKMGIDWVLARRAVMAAGLPAGGGEFKDYFWAGLQHDIAAANMADGLSTAIAAVSADDNKTAEAMLCRLSLIVNSEQSLDVKLVGLRSLFMADWSTLDRVLSK